MVSATRLLVRPAPVGCLPPAAQSKSGHSAGCRSDVTLTVTSHDSTWADVPAVMLKGARRAGRGGAVSERRRRTLCGGCGAGDRRRHVHREINAALARDNVDDADKAKPAGQTVGRKPELVEQPIEVLQCT